MAEKYLTNSDFNKALPKDTAEKFKVIGMNKRTSLRMNFAVFGTIDFRTLTLKQAEQLLNKKFPRLERVSKTKKSEKADEQTADTDN